MNPTYQSEEQRQASLSAAGVSASSLPQAQAPTTAADVNPMSGTKLPGNAPTTGNVSNAIAGVEGLKAQQEAIMKMEADRVQQAKEDLDRSLATQTKNEGFLSSLIKDRKSNSDVRVNSFQSIGIDPSKYFADQKAGIAEIGVLNQEYNKYKAEGEQQKAALIGQGRGIPMDLLNNQAAQIDRNNAPRLNMLSANINSKAAVLQAEQGNFNEAKSFVNQAVEDATADSKFEFDSFKMFYDMNENNINRLSGEYKDALNNTINTAQKKYENEKATKTEIGNLMLKYNQLKAGITMTDTLEEAQKKAAAVGGDLAYYESQQRIQDKYSAAARDSKASSGVTSGFKDSKIESSIREDASSLLDNVEAGTITLDKAYNKLRLLYSKAEATDQALKDVLGILPPQPAPAQLGDRNQLQYPEKLADFQNSIANLLFSNDSFSVSNSTKAIK